MRYVTDGGAKANGFGDDVNNCAVISFAVAMSISYKEARTILDAAGWTPVNGFYIIDFFKYCTFKGYNITEKVFKKGTRPTFEEFASKHNKGTWVVYAKGHVIAVVNGDIFDSRLKCNKKVRVAWKIEKV